MARRSESYDNAAAERFFAALESEIGTILWPDRESARVDVFGFTQCTATADGCTPRPAAETSTKRLK
ncbi:hypothetical protein ABZ826_18955 [Streptomyces sp. NPDC047515]|uniref:hypothetical protein n=1 Tax=Streptomyces sp. NPDC047515 TaxID=3155380 RepID=UPI003406380A